MAALATYLATLSKRADELLEKHHQELFDLSLDVSFNRATLATKYWLPLPGRDEPTSAHEDGYPHDESDERLFSALRECERILEQFETAVMSERFKMAVLSDLYEVLPAATSAFAQSVRKISRMIDKRRQSSDSDSDSSSPGSSALHTQGADKAGLQPQSHGRISPLGFIGDETHRISAAQEGNAQRLASNAQMYEPMEFNILERPRDSAEDEDDLLSSPRGSRTQRYPPKPQDDDTSQTLHSHNHPMGSKSTEIGTYNIPGARPSPGRMVSGKDFAPEEQYGYASTNSATNYATILRTRLATRLSPIKALPTVRDHTTDQLDAEGKEYIPRDIDPSGETKVSEHGHPLDGRDFRCRTFRLPDRGETLFMLATECARVLAYRQSYLLFNKNRSLFEIILTQTEKDDLIQQEILPYSCRLQQIAVVTARSMFRQFGSRLIQDGRRVRDDYWELKARQQGFTEEDAAGEKRPGAARARETAAAEAGSFVSVSSLSKFNDRDGNMRKQGYTEEHGAGSLVIHHDKTLVDTSQDPYNTSQPGLGQEPPTSTSADLVMPTSITSFTATRPIDQSACLDEYWRAPHESPE